MNGRQAIRFAIISRKMQHWAMVARNPKAYSHICQPSRARRNYWRLIARYPEIAARLGFNEASVYL